MSTIHHPKCKALVSGNVCDCNCGGAAFTIADSPDRDWLDVLDDIHRRIEKNLRNAESEQKENK